MRAKGTITVAVTTLLIASVAAAVFLFPWKSFLHDRIVLMLAARGVSNLDFQLEDVSLTSATLVDVKLGEDNPLLLDKVTLEYTVRELIDGTLRDIKLSGLAIQIREGENGWSVTGLDAIKPKRAAESAPLDIPAILSSLPFRSLNIEDSRLTVTGAAVNATIPFTANFQDSLQIETQPTTFRTGTRDIAVSETMIVLSPQDNGKTWSGSWSVSSVTGEDIPLPPMAGAGTLSVTGASLALDGDLYSANKDYNAAIKAEADFISPGNNKLRIVSASGPFKQGRISTGGFDVKFPMTVPVRISKISVDDLMQSFTGKRVNATGTLSGTVPVTISKAGGYTIGKGTLKADGTGRISMPADVIPGDNQQVALVREVLENLQYSLLSLNVTPGKGRNMAVLLRLEGRNPDVYNGRPVKLNINLTGDVLDIVEQNIMLFKTPEKLLQQELHE
ncbi:MAG: hypothetical protein DI626_00420 [Micavibrio aeruginosavorus]|uniref:Uncharacterized protein n=1 Tax=Micavibrio aeruginosavorus TaxID=349221 RepID=A0A2W5A8Y8_9BACT|nr:MAG: hypothetical protein DI626_00420 [Micavibrio aeruginosavorus]